MMQCPICDGPTQSVFSKGGHQIFGCRSCGHQCISAEYSPQSVQGKFGDDYFQGGQVCYLDYLKEADLLRDQGRRCGRLLSRYMTPGRALDIGSAAGFILKGLTDFGWQGFGIEPNPGMSAFARDHLGLDVTNTTIEEYQANRSFDLVSMFHVLPHIAEPKRLARRVAELLVPGGYWLIEIWNRESSVARLFGQSWHEYDPPRVLHWYSPRSLRRLTGPLGFRQIAWGRPVKWLQVSKLLCRMPSWCCHRVHSQAQVGHQRTLNVPYPGDDLAWVLLQKP